MSEDQSQAKPAGGLGLLLKNVLMFVLAAVVAGVCVQVGKRVAPGLFGAPTASHTTSR